MDLKSFVADTLAELMAGIEEAQRKLADGDHASPSAERQQCLRRINPPIARPMAEGRRLQSAEREPVYDVEFDIAVTVAEVAGTKTGIKVLGLSVRGEIDTKATQVSRIQFKVPVQWPR